MLTTDSLLLRRAPAGRRVRRLVGAADAIAVRLVPRPTSLRATRPPRAAVRNRAAPIRHLRPPERSPAETIVSAGIERMSNVRRPDLAATGRRTRVRCCVALPSPACGGTAGPVAPGLGRERFRE